MPDEETKYSGLENLDVGSKFKMFEKGGDNALDDIDLEQRGPASDRYGIMEKLKRLQEGEDLDDLLAEIDEELPSNSDDEDEDKTEVRTAVQKRTRKAEKLFGEGGQERRDKLAEERRKELKTLREKLMQGTKDSVLDQFGDLLNASANRVKKTKVDVRSENAKKFRDLFDQGQVPEGGPHHDRVNWEKEQELEQMRKSKREQKEFFKKLESGELEADNAPKEPKLLVGKIKDVRGDSICSTVLHCSNTTPLFLQLSEIPGIPEDMPEMTSLSNRFSFFENYTEKEEEKKKKKSFRMTPPREGLSPTVSNKKIGLRTQQPRVILLRVQEEDGDEAGDRKNGLMTETDLARKECKARSVLNKFKEMENKVLNGEEDGEWNKLRCKYTSRK